MTAPTRNNDTVRRPLGSRWGVGPTLWLAGMVGAWIAFGAVALAAPTTLENLWSGVQGLPLPAEIALWIATFPLMLALAVHNSSWSDSLQIALIASFAIGWTLASIPRRKSREAPSIHWELKPGEPHDHTITWRGVRHLHGGR